MKKIKKLTLQKEQTLNKEELRHIVAGDNWYLRKHTWACGCTQKGQCCYEVYTYTVIHNDPSTRYFHEMPRDGIFCDPTKVGLGMYVIQWGCEAIDSTNGNKFHKILSAKFYSK